MWNIVAGPYSSGANTAESHEHNLAALTRMAYAIVRWGHTPIIGINLALPIIEAIGPDVVDDVMTPMSLALAERCDGKTTRDQKKANS